MPGRRITPEGSQRPPAETPSPDESAPFATPSLSAGAHLDLAYAYEDRGNYEPALVEVDRALQAESGLAEAHNLRGLLLEELDRTDEALAAVVRTVMSVTTRVLTGSWRSLVTAALVVSHAVANVVKAIWRFTVNVVGAVWGAVAASARRFWGWLRPPLAALWHAVVQIASAIRQGAVAIIRTVWLAVGKVTRAIWTQVSNLARSIGHGLEQALSALRGELSRSIHAASESPLRALHDVQSQLFHR